MSAVGCCSDGMFFLMIVQLSSHKSSEQRSNKFFFPSFSRMSLEVGLLPFQEKASPCARKEENPKLWYL